MGRKGQIMENNAGNPSADAVDTSTDLSADQIDQDTSYEGENSLESLTDDNGADSVEAKINAAQAKGDLTKKQADSLKKKYNLKIDGKEEELELDLSNDDEVKKYLQKAKSFDKRSQEFAGFKTNVQKFIEKLKNDPDSGLAELGIDVDSFAEKRIQKRLEEMSKSPEELEKEKMRAELETLRREKEEAAKAKEEAEQMAILQKTALEIEQGIMKAMDNTKSILPKNNPMIIGEIAKAMKEAMRRGYNEVTVEDVVPLVEKRYKEQLKSLFDILPEDALEMMIGNNNLDRLRKRRVAKAAPQTARQAVQDTGKSSVRQKDSDESDDKKNKIAYSDFFRR